MWGQKLLHGGRTPGGLYFHIIFYFRYLSISDQKTDISNISIFGPLKIDFFQFFQFYRKENRIVHIHTKGIRIWLEIDGSRGISNFRPNYACFWGGPKNRGKKHFCLLGMPYYIFSA